jgi:hypothetical protein
MAFTYQFGANPQIDYPRLLIGDTDSTNQVFQDSEILAAYNIIPTFFITPNAGNGQAAGGNFTAVSYYRVAAILLDALAGMKSRLAAQLKVLDIELNVTDAARELRATAKEYRDIEDHSGAFAIVEMVPNNYAAYERVWKQLLRLNQ